MAAGDNSPTLHVIQSPPSTSPQIGIVASISGTKLTCRLMDRSEADSDASAVVQIGSMVKIATRTSLVFGLVNELSHPLLAQIDGARSLAIAEIDLIGEMIERADSSARFSRGITLYPRLDVPVQLAAAQDLAKVYSRPDASAVRIGTLYQDPSLTAYLLAESFLSRHSAILGTTGTGKSCALTLILRSLLTGYPNGHVVMIDPHGEYGAAFPDIGEIISASTLQLPYWLLNYEEIVEIFCSKDPVSRNREAAILRDAILSAKRDALKKSNPNMVITVDTPVPYSLTTVVQHINDARGKLDRPDNTPLPYLRLIDAIEAFSRDERYRFMFGHLAVRDDFAAIVSRIIRVPVEGRPITIVDISGIPPEITDVVVSVLCRLVFDFARWSMHEATPVLFVFDEAHRYIPRDPTAGFEPTRRSIARIAKEGRKYALSLCLVTQRPSEISEAVLSQCSTVVAFRLSNQHDQEFVRRTVPEDAAGFLSNLPMLGQQEAVAVGEGVSHAMRIRVDELPAKFQPKSVDSSFTSAWQSDSKNRSFVQMIIQRWRQQSY
jgi:uncharacterized protein